LLPIVWLIFNSSSIHDVGREGRGLSSLKKRLDNVLNELSNMDIEPDEEASGNVVAELSIIKGAFKESERYPVCCFTFDSSSRIVCDTCGPLPTESFMEKCRVCQAQIKEALSILKNA
jgi:hypothetical protein